MAKIKNLVSYEITETYHGTKELTVETKGDLGSMPRNAELVTAIYGTWQRTENGTLLYSQHLHLEDTTEEIESALQDDYNALLKGNVTKVY